MIQTTKVDIDRARAIWREFQQAHDIASIVGQTAGIDPVTGEVFFGSSAKEISMRLQVEGTHRPLYFVRIGSDHYVEKRGRR